MEDVPHDGLSQCSLGLTLCCVTLDSCHNYYCEQSVGDQESDNTCSQSYYDLRGYSEREGGLGRE